MKDEIIEEFGAKWDAASEWSLKAKILRGLVLYIKQRYRALEAYIPLIEPKLAELEAVVGELYDPKEFLTVSGAIGYIRGRIKERSAGYASAVKGSANQRDGVAKERLSVDLSKGDESPFGALDHDSAHLRSRGMEFG